MRPIVCSETSVKNYHYRCIIAQTDAVIICFVAEDRITQISSPYCRKFSTVLPQNPFSALSHNFDGEMLVSSCLSVRPSGRPHGTNVSFVMPFCTSV